MADLGLTYPSISITHAHIHVVLCLCVCLSRRPSYLPYQTVQADLQLRLVQLQISVTDPGDHRHLACVGARCVLMSQLHQPGLRSARRVILC